MSETGEQKKPASTEKELQPPNDEMMNQLMQDLVEIGKSLNLIKEGITPIIKRIQNFGKRKSSFFISHEFMEKIKDAKVRMNALRMFAAHNISINFIQPARKCIQLEIQGCAQLFKKPQFQVNSIKHRMFRFDWFLRAKRTEKGHLGLFLHAQPSDGFKGQWRIEADIRLCIWNNFSGNKLIMADEGTIYGNGDGNDHCHTARGYREMAKLMDLLNPANGFLRFNGSIKVDVQFQLINLCKQVKLTDNMTEQKNAMMTAVTANDDGMEFDGMVGSLMAELAKMKESHNQITKELTRFQFQTHGTSDSVINDEFIVRMAQLKENMNLLKSLVADSVNIKPIRKSIQLELKNCRELFAKKKFSVFSIKRKVLLFNWYLKATTVEKGFLCLILFAEPPDGFNGQYRMEIDDRYSILSESGKQILEESFGNVFENDAEDPENIYTGQGYDKLAKFELLLDTANGYIGADGSIKIEVDIVVKSSSLNHLASE